MNARAQPAAGSQSLLSSTRSHLSSVGGSVTPRVPGVYGESSTSLHESYRNLVEENVDMASKLRRANETISNQAKLISCNIMPLDGETRPRSSSPKDAPVTAQLMFFPRVLDSSVRASPRAGREAAQQPEVIDSCPGCSLCRGNAVLVEELRREMEQMESLNSHLTEDLRLRDREYLALLAATDEVRAQLTEELRLRDRKYLALQAAADEVREAAKSINPSTVLQDVARLQSEVERLQAQVKQGAEFIGKETTPALQQATRKIDELHIEIKEKGRQLHEKDAALHQLEKDMRFLEIEVKSKSTKVHELNSKNVFISQSLAEVSRERDELSIVVGKLTLALTEIGSDVSKSQSIGCDEIAGLETPTTDCHRSPQVPQIVEVEKIVYQDRVVERVVEVEKIVYQDRVVERVVEVESQVLRQALVAAESEVATLDATRFPLGEEDDSYSASLVEQVENLHRELRAAPASIIAAESEVISDRS
jgi:hypothetical protein